MLALVFMAVLQLVLFNYIHVLRVYKQFLRVCGLKKEVQRVPAP